MQIAIGVFLIVIASVVLTPFLWYGGIAVLDSWAEMIEDIKGRL